MSSSAVLITHSGSKSADYGVRTQPSPPRHTQWTEAGPRALSYVGPEPIAPSRPPARFETRQLDALVTRLDEAACTRLHSFAMDAKNSLSAPKILGEIEPLLALTLNPARKTRLAKHLSAFRGEALTAFRERVFDLSREHLPNYNIFRFSTQLQRVLDDRLIVPALQRILAIRYPQAESSSWDRTITSVGLHSAKLALHVHDYFGTVVGIEGHAGDFASMDGLFRMANSRAHRNEGNFLTGTPSYRAGQHFEAFNCFRQELLDQRAYIPYESDVVLLCDVANHTPYQHDNEFLVWAYDHLKPGGMLIVLVDESAANVNSDFSIVPDKTSLLRYRSVLERLGAEIRVRRPLMLLRTVSSEVEDRFVEAVARTHTLSDTDVRNLKQYAADFFRKIESKASPLQQPVAILTAFKPRTVQGTPFDDASERFAHKIRKPHTDQPYPGNMREFTTEELFEKYLADRRETPISKEILRRYLPLVRRCAQQILDRKPYLTITYSELVNEGYFALEEKLRDFNPELNVGFGVAAKPAVKGRMREFIRSQMPLPRSVYDRYKSWSAKIHELAISLGNDPNVQEICEYLGENFELVDSTLTAVGHFNHYPPRQEYSYRAWPEEVALQNEFWDTLLSELNETDERAVRLYFRGGYTMKEIGDALGVVESNVSHRITRVRKTLQDRIRVSAGQGGFYDELAQEHGPIDTERKKNLRQLNPKPRIA